MKRLRRCIFWAHLVVGLIVGLGVAFLALTGLTLSFEKQVVEWAERVPAPPPAPGASRQSVESLIRRVRTIEPAAAPTSVVISNVADEPVAIVAGRGQILFLNAYTGDLVGREAGGLREFFAFVTRLHRWLALPADWRDWGRQTTGVVGLGFLLLIVSGLWLWFPKKLRWNAFRAVTVPSVRLRGKPRDWNWHNAFGFWALIPLLIITVTGTIVGYPWASNLVYYAVGDTPPTPRQTTPATNAVPAGGDASAGGPRARFADPRRGDVERASAVAPEQARPGSRSQFDTGSDDSRAGQNRATAGTNAAATPPARVDGRAGRRPVESRPGDDDIPPAGNASARPTAPEDADSATRSGADGEARAGGERLVNPAPGAGTNRREESGRRGPATRPIGSGGERVALNLRGIDRAVAEAQKASGDWAILTVRLAERRGRDTSPEDAAAARNQVAVVVSARPENLPPDRTTYVFDRRDGTLVRTDRFTDLSPGRQLRSVVVPLHRGELLGLPGQIVAALACVSALVLVWTGAALSWRRFFKTRRATRLSAEVRDPVMSDPVPA